MLFFAYFVKDFEDFDVQECEDGNMTDAWLSQVCNERKNCFEDQRKANKVMIKRFTKRNRVVLKYIFNAESKSRKGKKILGKIPAFEGRIIEKRKNEYKVQYETDDHKLMVDWFPVKAITSKTKYEENKSRIKGKAIYFSNLKSFRF